MDNAPPDFSIGKRLRLVRTAAKETQRTFSERIGIPFSSYQGYEMGLRVPGGEALKLLANAGVDVIWLLTGRGSMLLNTSSVYEVSSEIGALELKTAEHEFPYHEASPKSPDYSNDSQASYQDWRKMIDATGFFPVRYLDGREALGEAPYLFSRAALESFGLSPEMAFVVKVHGDAMSPTLKAGSHALCHAGRKVPASGLYAVRIDGSYLLKRLESVPGGKIRVISDNPAYSEYLTDGISEAFEVLGEVVWMGVSI